MANFNIQEAHNRMAERNLLFLELGEHERRGNVVTEDFDRRKPEKKAARSSLPMSRTTLGTSTPCENIL